MDILLIDPPYKSLRGIGVDCAYAMGLASLAGYLTASGIDAAILTGDLLVDMAAGNILNMDANAYAEGQAAYKKALLDDGHPLWSRIVSAIVASRPQAIGIMYLTPARDVVEKIAALVKQIDADLPVIAGAHHPSFRPADVLQNRNIDFAVRGEGELPLTKLVREILDGRHNWANVPGLTYRDADGTLRSTADADLIADLDSLPVAGRDCVLDGNYRKYRTHYVHTARGCPSSCAFCSDSRMWRHAVRRRSVSNVLAELRLLKAEYDPAFVDFSDGTFTFDPKYLRHFCQAMIAEDLNLMWRCTARFDNLTPDRLRLMKAANCFGLYLGLESGSADILKSVNKKTSPARILEAGQMIRDSGMISMASVLVGLPDEKPADIRETLALMRKMDCDLFDVNCYVPLPGTPLASAMDPGAFESIDWMETGFKSLTTNFSRHMTNRQFQEFVLEAYQIAEEARLKFLHRTTGLAN